MPLISFVSDLKAAQSGIIQALPLRALEEKRG
jgi:hypothetical protein